MGGSVRPMGASVHPMGASVQPMGTSVHPTEPSCNGDLFVMGTFLFWGSICGYQFIGDVFVWGRFFGGPNCWEYFFGNVILGAFFGDHMSGHT